MITIGSLFSGIGGLELGLEAALGAATIWQCELDPYARLVLEKHWPDVERYDDVKTMVRPPYVDLICGGFPCQNISAAGKRDGVRGEKSSLWFEFARIIGEVKPSFVIIENSENLARRGLIVVLEDLARLGYDAEWSVVSARSVGAPHRRNRMFIVAWRSDTDRARLLQLCSRNEPEAKSVAFKPWNDASGLGPPERGYWSAEPNVGRVVDGYLSWVDRRKRVARVRCLGNAVVPQVAYRVGLKLREIMERENEQEKV